jgi:hypothetical protein
MSREANDLRRLQSWMRAVITHPSGIGAGVRSDAARQSFDLSLADLQKLIEGSASLSGAERLAIYGRAYFARLADCFRAEFPCLLQLLGEELFGQFVTTYLHRHPPRSYTLHHLAKHFPKYLAETRPDAGAPPEEREDWPDFIIDLAVLERTFVEVYDGPGAEDLPPVSALEILGLSTENLVRSRFMLAPCVRLMAFRYPVHGYFSAVRKNRQPLVPAPADSFLAVTRSDYIVRFLDLSRPQYEILDGLLAGLSVEQAGARAAQSTGQSPEVINPQLRDWLCQWANLGLFLA